MKNYSKTIPAGMLFKKHYCHNCGARFAKNPHTRTVTRKDPDWKKHSKLGRGRVLFGDIEVTEYDYICTECEHIIEYDEQVIIDKIQKKLGKKVLSESELEHGWETASESVKKTKKIIGITGKIIAFTLLAISLYFSMKNK